MVEATVIDANCWSAYVDEHAAGIDGVAIATFRRAQGLGKILFDELLSIRQQYVNVKRGFGETLLSKFFDDGVIFGHVKLIAVPPCVQTRKELLSLGIPAPEHIYFRTAKAGGANYIVSEDIDFFHPAIKKRGEAEKSAAKRSTSAPVCKHFRKGYGISIQCMDVFVASGNQQDEA